MGGGEGGLAKKHAQQKREFSHFLKSHVMSGRLIGVASREVKTRDLGITARPSPSDPRLDLRLCRVP
jgi:hypothetical protein